MAFLIDELNDSTRSYEKRIVADICKRIGLPKPPAEGDFEWFAGQPSKFRVHLRCGRYRHIHATTLNDLVGRAFLQWEPLSELGKMVEELGEEMPSVLVFSWKHFGVTGNDMVVLHTVPGLREPFGFHFVRKMPNGNLVTLQTLRTLIRDLNIGDGE